MKKENIYKIGGKLGITEGEIKATLNKHRNIIIAGVFYVLALAYLGIDAYQPVRRPMSINDFDFFMRFF